jgi:hypothetical protein
MASRPSYLAAAFNARPFGMPVPPNWFVIAGFALLGALVNPGFWLIGAGVEGLYLWALSRNARFRSVVDAGALRTGAGGSDANSRYSMLLQSLGQRSLDLQRELEQKAGEIVTLLKRIGANETQIADVQQMAWLHLKLLAARASLEQVMSVANRDREELETQEKNVSTRLAAAEADADLKRSLAQQLEVIRSRRAAHADAGRRCTLVDAELERLRQQVSLVREQALLATDEQSVATSLDALSASLNEANRWLKDQQEIFAGLDDLTDEPPPELLQAASATSPNPRTTTRKAQRETQ